MKPITKIIVGLLLCLALATSASAKVCIAKVTGVVTSVRTSRSVTLDGSVNVGSAMTGFCIYDTNTPDMDSSPSHGSYPVMSLSMIVGNYTFTYDPAIDLIVQNLPTLPAMPSTGASWGIWTDGYSCIVSTSAPRFDGIVYINGSPKTFDDISWSYYNNHITPIDVRSSGNEFNLPDTLPETIPFSTFDLEKSFEAAFDFYFSINGQITSLVAAPWPFQFTPDRIIFQSCPGDPNPPPQVLSIWAEEGNTVNWQITKDCNWLDVSPASGQSSGEIDQVTLSVNTAGLDIGYYSCSLAISDPNIPDSTRFLPVNLLIGQGLFVPGQYPTIQAAIDDANNGDIIIVAPGTYTGSGNHDIDFLGKAITVVSTDPNDPNVVASTIIDCQQHTGFNFHGGEDVNSILKGFIIIDGAGRSGGAIRCDNSSPEITDCIITGNSCSIYCRNGSHPEIIDCNITANSSSGIYCDGNALISGCKITGNSGYCGGGIRCECGRPTITNCTIIGNSASGSYFLGGGICCDNATITDCNISGNSFSISIGDYGGGIFCFSEVNSTIADCTISDNTGDGICFPYNTLPGPGYSMAIIKNCTIAGNSGSGISGPLVGPITNCNITGNSGSGISGCDGPITNCNITSNSGGGISGGIYGCSGPITNCKITGNSVIARGCNVSGGGLSDCSGPVTNCIISGNAIVSPYAYGGGLAGCRGPITNCTIIGNSTAGNFASLGGGLYDCSQITNCIIWNDWPDQVNGDYIPASVTYSDVQGGYLGLGNIDADPCFVQPGHWDSNGTPNDANDDFWIDGDYHLKSEGWRWDTKRSRWTYDDVTSRCIDAGNPGSPLGDELLSVPDDPNNVWGQNLRIDMGAFGGTAEASIPPYDWAILGDLTNDGLVNLEDYAYQAADWLNSADQQPGDLNRDGIVDIADLALLVEDWLEQTSWH